MSILQMAAIAGNGVPQNYVDDVFSTWVYTGTGATQTITNGIDLAGQGGLVWIKDRGTGGAVQHHLVDTVRGASEYLFSNGTNGSQNSSSMEVTGFNSNGFSLGSGGSLTNYSAYAYASWSFRKAAKFFDVVTYTGNGTTQTFNHSLGVTPGIVIVKSTSGAGNWNVFHRSATGLLKLNLTDAESGAISTYFSSVTSTSVSVTDSAPGMNNNGTTYIAYLFAHDTGTDGIVQCGSYVGDGNIPGPVVTLGWEPQYLLIRNATNGSNWTMLDTMRGMSETDCNRLLADTSNAEFIAQQCAKPVATGFQLTTNSSICNTSGVTYIYLAIRRPNKPPTLGTQVYNAIKFTSGSTGTKRIVGFPVDLQISCQYDKANYLDTWFVDRLRGVSTTTASSGVTLASNSSATESTAATITRNWGDDGFEDPNYYSTLPAIFWNFRRAPGVFDQVCYTGTGVANKKVAHNLQAIPELIIVKDRSSANLGMVYTAAGGNGVFLRLFAGATSDYAFTANTDPWNSTSPTALEFTVDGSGGYIYVNANGDNYVAYLFATKAGISKVGSYTGNGSSQTINCGFTTGARFILIKRTDSTGDWFVWDSVRGIVAGSDPHLSLNTTAAEVTTDDSIDPDTSGFIVNQDAATDINVNAATYIYLSLA